MPVAKVQLPDGRVARIEVPEGATEQQALDFAKAQLDVGAREFVRSSTDLPTPQEGMRGVVMGARDVVDAGAQLLVRGAKGVGLADEGEVKRVDDIVKLAEQEYQAGRRSKGFDAPRVAGNILGTLPAIATLPAKAGLAARAATGSAAGAIQGALTPVTEGGFGTDKLKQIGTGAGIGALAAPVAGAAARIIRPKTSGQSTELLKGGVRLTPGQTLAGKDRPIFADVVRRIEEGATSIPILGDAIRASQRRAVEDFNRMVINKSLQFIGKKLPKTVSVGHKAVDTAHREISIAYDDVIPKLKGLMDQEFTAGIKALQNVTSARGTSVLPEAQAKQFDGVMKTVLQNFNRKGEIGGEALKEQLSKLSRLSRLYSKSENPDHRLLGEMIEEARTVFHDMLVRVNPSQAKTLSSIDSAYAHLLRVENAAARSGSKGGVFTPAQLSAAVRSLDPSLRKSSFARGKAMMQGTAEAGERILGRTVPDSGTPFRALVSTGIPGVVMGAATSPLALAYTPFGQTVSRLLLTSRPEVATPIAEGVRRSAPFVAAPIGLGASQ